MEDLSKLGYMKLKRRLVELGVPKSKVDACPGKPTLLQLHHKWAEQQAAPPANAPAPASAPAEQQADPPANAPAPASAPAEQQSLAMEGDDERRDMLEALKRCKDVPMAEIRALSRDLERVRAVYAKHPQCHPEQPAREPVVWRVLDWQGDPDYCWSPADAFGVQFGWRDGQLRPLLHESPSMDLSQGSLEPLIAQVFAQRESGPSSQYAADNLRRPFNWALGWRPGAVFQLANNGGQLTIGVVSSGESPVDCVQDPRAVRGERVYFKLMNCGGHHSGWKRGSDRIWLGCGDSVQAVAEKVLDHITVPGAQLPPGVHELNVIDIRERLAPSQLVLLFDGQILPEGSELVLADFGMRADGVHTLSCYQKGSPLADEALLWLTSEEKWTEEASRPAAHCADSDLEEFWQNRPKDVFRSKRVEFLSLRDYWRDPEL